jgi:Secretion system C-terminal sorting domain
MKKNIQKTMHTLFIYWLGVLLPLSTVSAQTDCDGCGGGGALPVSLVDFKVKKEGSINYLKWTTAREIHNKGFQIERISDNRNWSILGFVDGKNAKTNYEFEDVAPLPISYYRLRQIDFDGKESLSKIISIKSNGWSKPKVYPSVTNGLLTIENADASSPRELNNFQIFNLLGQQVLSGETGGQVNVSLLQKGIYVVRMGTEFSKFVKE